MWTKKEFELLCDMAEDQCCANQIANRLGRTKDSVLGKAWRNGIEIQGGRNRREQTLVGINYAAYRRSKT